MEKAGSWYSFNGERIGHGRENSKQFLKDNPDRAAKLGLPPMAFEEKPVAKGKGSAA